MEKLHYPARKLSPTMEPFDMLPSQEGGGLPPTLFVQKVMVEILVLEFQHCLYYK